MCSGMTLAFGPDALLLDYLYRITIAIDRPSVSKVEIRLCGCTERSHILRPDDAKLLWIKNKLFEMR